MLRSAGVRVAVGGTLTLRALTCNLLGGKVNYPKYKYILPPPCGDRSGGGSPSRATRTLPVTPEPDSIRARDPRARARALEARATRRP